MIRYLLTISALIVGFCTTWADDGKKEKPKADNCKGCSKIVVEARKGEHLARGTISKIDADKGTCTVKLKDGDKEMTISKDTPCRCPLKGELKQEARAKALCEGADLLVKWKKDGDKEVVLEVVFMALERQPKKEKAK